MTKQEKIQKGIESFEYRLAALAEKFSTSRNTDTDKAALELSKQINVYGRSLEILRREAAKEAASNNTYSSFYGANNE